MWNGCVKIDRVRVPISIAAVLKRLTSHWGAVVVLLIGGLIAVTRTSAAAEPSPGLGVAIVYDTSGSMNDRVKDSAGNSAPKFQIANRALLAAVDRLEAFHKANPDRPLKTNLVIFFNNGGMEAVPFGDFDAAKLRSWIRAFNKPNGSTPLGTAIRTAAEPLLKSNLQHKHILVVTDGMNTSGPDPAAILPALRKEAASGGGALGMHFVAFDVAAKVFDPVKKLDATVVPAADEKQLQTQLSFIMERKILLEDEEPAPAPKKP